MRNHPIGFYTYNISFLQQLLGQLEVHFSLSHGFVITIILNNSNSPISYDSEIYNTLL